MLLTISTRFYANFTSVLVTLVTDTLKYRVMLTPMGSTGGVHTWRSVQYFAVHPSGAVRGECAAL